MEQGASGLAGDRWARGTKTGSLRIKQHVVTGKETCSDDVRDCLRLVCVVVFVSVMILQQLLPPIATPRPLASPSSPLLPTCRAIPSPRSRLYICLATLPTSTPRRSLAATFCTMAAPSTRTLDVLTFPRGIRAPSHRPSDAPNISDNKCPCISTTTARRHDSHNGDSQPKEGEGGRRGREGRSVCDMTTTRDRV